MHIDVQNTQPVVVEKMIKLKGFGRPVWFLVDAQGELRSFISDPRDPVATRPVKDLDHALPLRLEPGDTVQLYVGVRTIANEKFFFTIWDPEEFRFAKTKQYIVNGVYFGLILALVIYNLFLYISLRGVNYLLFALFLASSASAIYIAMGFPAIAGLRGNFPLSTPLTSVVLGMTDFFSYLLSISLLNIRRTNSRLFQFWLLVIVVNIANNTFLAIAFFDPSTATENLIYLSFATSGLATLLEQIVFIATLIYYWNRSSIVRYWFLGLMLHSWALIAMIVMGSGSTLPFEPYNIVQLATVIDSILFSWILGYSFNQAQEERILAQQKSVEHLRLANDIEQAKSNFVATVGHDLHGPVGAIRNFTAGLRGVVPTESQRDLDRIDDNVTTITELLDSLLALSRTDSIGKDMKLERTDLNQILTNMKTEFLPKAITKGLALEVDVPSDCFVSSNRVALSQVLRNLIENAIKYTHEGSVNVSVDDSGDQVVVAVRDTGKGVASGQLSRIFDDFYQVDKSTGGVGLGLSIVARLTRQLGVTMEVESNPGEGSCFTLYIEKLAPEVAPNETEEPELDIDIIWAGDPGIVARTVELIRGWGAETYQVDSLAGRLPVVPDLVVADLASWQSYTNSSVSSTANKTPAFRFIVITQHDEVLEEAGVLNLPLDASAMHVRSLVQRAVGLVRATESSA